MKAYVFPGQGAQKKGMGSDVFDLFPDFVERADEILGYSLKELCLYDAEKKLNQTLYTQPVLYVVNSLSYLAKINQGTPKPEVVAGHSLGEYCALFAAEAFNYENGLRLVKKRAEIMAGFQDGKMAAIVGLDEKQITTILSDNNLETIDISNYNSPSQFVISGPQADIERAQNIFEKADAKLYLILNVSGAFHSRYMEKAKKEFSRFLRSFSFSAPKISVISNVTAEPYEDNELKFLLADQITSPVRWTDTVRKIIDMGAGQIEEIGSSNVLSRLVSDIKKTQAVSSSKVAVKANIYKHIMNAANKGLFLKKDSFQVYKNNKEKTILDHNLFEKRSYTIRFATLDDLSKLVVIENKCWPIGTRSSLENLQQRIKNHPDGQLVLEFNDAIAGVIYSQRIVRIDDLQKTDYKLAQNLHRQEGQIIQLLAINVLPEMQHQSIGNQLLEFMLQISSFVEGVNTVVGITRCNDYYKHSSVKPEDYIRIRNERGGLLDTTLRFHELHGGNIEKVIHNYRPLDKKNKGCGVLVKYDLNDRKTPRFEAKKTDEPITSIEKFIKETILSLLQDSKRSAFNLNRPLMEVGLDSLNLLELNERIEHYLNIKLNPIFFFKHKTADSIIKYLKAHIAAKGNNIENKSILKSIKNKKECAENDIAIIGVSCRLPGDISTKEQLWTLLKNNESAIQKKPATRWQWPSNIDLNHEHLGIDFGGFLTNIASFDPAFFHISPKEAELMDPQQRILLEMSWECLEDAAIQPSVISGSRTGVFIGVSGSDYSRLSDDNLQEITAHSGIGTSTAIIPNRISYFFNFNGPSLQIDTACSSSLVATHEAVKSLLNGECEQALVGGINIMCHPYNSIVYYKAGMLSRDGKCRTFDEQANGYVRSEGAVVILLKPLQKAIVDSDPIYAVIKGSAINHGGQASGLTAPNPERQKSLLIESYEKIGHSIESLGYIETHGTGTSLGDPIEIEGLFSAFSELMRKNKEIKFSHCGLGSIKSNLGHLEAASGLVGLLKVILCLNNKELPATANFNKLNRNINLDHSHFYIVDKNQKWELPKKLSKRTAGVSSFGSGGTNAHVILEEYQPPGIDSDGGLSFYPICFSAKTAYALQRKRHDLIKWLKNDKKTSLKDFSQILLMGREHFELREAFIARNIRGWQKQVIAELKNRQDKKHLKQIESNIDVINKSSRKLISDLIIDNVKNYEGDLKQLVDLYIQGASIDWAKIYKNKQNANNVCLPYYPFEHNDYWITNALQDSQHSSDNLAEFIGQEFTVTFKKQDPFIKDHVVKGKKIFPAAAYLEIIMSKILSSKKEARRDNLRLKNVVWLNPLIINSDHKEVVTVLSPCNDNSIEYEIYNKQPKEKLIHSKGIVINVESKNTASLDIKTIKKRSIKEKDAFSYYNMLKKQGFDYGPNYRNIDAIYTGNLDLLARLSLPDQSTGNQQTFIMNTRISDAGLQAAVMLLNKNNSKLYLPFALDEMISYNAHSASRWIYVKQTSKKQNLMRADIDICDDKGNICASMRGLSLRAWDRTDNYDVDKNEQVLISPLSVVRDASIKQIAIFLKDLLSSVIKLPADKIDENTSMETYGIDSLMSMQLTAKLEKTFGALPKTLFFEYQNICDLAQYFIENHSAKLKQLLNMDNDIENVLFTEKTEQFRSKQKIEEVDAKYSHTSNEIAIIGLSGRYPFANNVEEYWENLKRGKNCITEIPKDRWNANLYFDNEKDKPGKSYSKWGGFLDDVDKFDSSFFNITPRECELMDPQERLFLQCVYETLEDAGYTKSNVDKSEYLGLSNNVGVYVGAMYQEYPFYGTRENTLVGLSSFISNRVSYFFDFHGPSMTIDTMCSSSFTAIHLACNAIYLGECTVAIAGGVNLSIHPNKYVFLSQNRFVSSKGLCESFGVGGDGYVPGEGVGAVLLKPLNLAIKDGDHIYGVIKSTSVNHGGKTNGLTVPNPTAQANVIKKVFEKSDINPRSISYIEAHGTGTALGDPIEILGLTRAFEQYTKEKQFCAIGSAKSNIGHCESAAGIAGLTKVLLQLKYRKIAPSLHSSTLNPNIDFSNTPFVVQQNLSAWEKPIIEENGELKEYPRIAGISSFGAGGSNAHILIEEFVEEEDSEDNSSRDKEANNHAILLSAKDKIDLKIKAETLLKIINEGCFRDEDISSISYTLQVGREVFDERLAILANSILELKQGIEKYLHKEEKAKNLFVGSFKKNNDVLTAFDHEEDLSQIIAKWMRNKEYNKLLQLWTNGFDIIWDEIYFDAHPKRISLPTYPFKKERHWIDGDGKESMRNDEEYITREAEISKVESILAYPEWVERQIIKETIDFNQHIIMVCGASESSQTLQLDEAKIVYIDSPQKELDKRFIYSATKAFEQIHAVFKTKIRNKLFLQFLLLCDNKSDVTFRGVSGLLKTAELENPNLVTQTIEMDSCCQAQTIVNRLKESRFTPNDKNIKYIKEKRLTLSWNEQTDSSYEMVVPWKENGIYLITGGLGGLGLIFAKEIISETISPKIILTGRSSLTHSKRQKIIELESTGATVEYRKADISDKDETEGVINYIKMKYGTINGIIHSAGIIKDSFILNKKMNDFQAVLLPKVSGAVNLDYACKDIMLDFFILFSSTSGAIGNVGQIDYACANAFIDAFAGHRSYLVDEGKRHGRTLSVNWPLWENGGMQVDEFVKEVMLDNYGVLPLKTETAIAALYKGYMSSNSQVMVLEGNVSKIKDKILSVSSKADNNIADLPELKEGSEVLQDNIVIQVRNLLSQITKLNDSRIDIDEPLDDYGIDSIVMVKLSRGIEKLFHCEISLRDFYEHKNIRAISNYIADQVDALQKSEVNEVLVDSLTGESIAVLERFKVGQITMEEMEYLVEKENF